MTNQLIPTLYIDDNAIRVIDGLYSLNDLHKAAGGENKDRPKYFLENQKTQELILELEGGIPPSKDLSCADLHTLNEPIKTIYGSLLLCK